MNSDYVLKELTAIENEYRKGLGHDGRRRRQCLKAIANPKHIWSKFSTGSLETLGKYDKELLSRKGKEPKEKEKSNPIIRQKLLDFHGKYYYPCIMGIAIVGPQELDELEALTLTNFAEFRNQKDQTPEKISQLRSIYSGVTEKLFDENALEKVLQVVPLKDTKSLQMLFQMPEPNRVFTEYMDGSQFCRHLLCHLVGHEGVGSLYYALKQKGLVTELAVGPSTSGRAAEVISCSIELSQQGTEKISEVVTHFFAFIEILKRETDEMIMKHALEAKKILDIGFQFMPKTSPLKWAIDCSHEIGYTQQNHIIDGGINEYKINLKYFRSYLENLTVDNCVVRYANRDLQKTFEEMKDQVQVEPYGYGSYLTRNFTKEEKEQWKFDESSELKDFGMRLPDLNDFIASDFEIVCDREKKGEIIYPSVLSEQKAEEGERLKFSNPNIFSSEFSPKLYYKMDNNFFLPDASLKFNFRVPSYLNMPKHQYTRKLLIDMIQDDMNELTYPMALASLVFRAGYGFTGFTFSFGGYNHKFNSLLEVVTQKIKNYDPLAKPERFEILKKKYVRRIRSRHQSQPYQWGFRVVDYMLYSSETNPLANEWIADSITIKDVAQLNTVLFENLDCEVISVGNMVPETTKSWTSKVFDTLCATSHGIPRDFQIADRITKLNSKETYHVDLIHPEPVQENNSIMFYFQLPEKNLREVALLKIFSSFAGTRCFDELRTKQELGYIAGGKQYSATTVMGYVFIVQSSEKTCQYLQYRIEEFIETLGQLLADISDKEYEASVNSIVENLLDPPKNLFSESQKYFARVRRGLENFGVNKAVADEVQKVSKKEMIEFYDKYFKVNAKDRRLLIVKVHGQKFVEKPKPNDRNEVVNTDKKKQVVLMESDIANWKSLQSSYRGVETPID